MVISVDMLTSFIDLVTINATDELGPLIASALSSTTGSVVDAEEGKSKKY